MSEEQQIRESQYFDSDWYLARYPDVALIGIDPVKHYLKFGTLLKRNPSADFDSAAYLAANPDVARAGVNPLLHYITCGRGEGRTPIPVQDASVPNPELHVDPGPADREQSSASVSEVPLSKGWELSETSNYGEHFQGLHEATLRRIQDPPPTKEYEAIKSAFDLTFYLMRYPDIARAVNVDPILHYIDHGAREGRDPSPDFSTGYYVARYPDVKASGLNPFYHYLKIGKPEGRAPLPMSAGDPTFDSFAEMLGRDPEEVDKQYADYRHALRSRLENGVLGEMVRRASKIEPLIAHTWKESMSAKFPPLHSEAPLKQLVSTFRLHSAAKHRRAQYVIVVNRPRWGGARRMEGNIAHALAKKCGAEEVVVLITDESGVLPARRFPDGCRVIDFASAAVGLGQPRRERLLVEFLRSLHPEAVFNINSRLLWDALATYDRVLSSAFDIIACFFCNERDMYGFWSGYPVKYLYRHFGTFKKICADSHFLKNWICTHSCASQAMEEKVVVLEAPVEPGLQKSKVPPVDKSRRRQVFWSGRLDRQKRIDIVYALADRMTDVDFRLWGESVLDSHGESVLRPDNVVLEGTYGHFSELPLKECDAWLYTSEWDGVPSILLEVAMTGIPLVGSCVGGTEEIMQRDLTEPVTDIDDVSAYEAGIRRILSDTDKARARADELRSVLIRNRSFENFEAILEGVLV